MNAQAFAERLNGRKSAGGWMAKCPAHEDKTASLSISSGDDGRVLANCHAGCRFPEIVRAANLEASDLFPEKIPTNTKPRIVAEYDYRDESGKLVYQALRLDQKTFRQRKPEGAGWSYSLKGVPRLPYRLPELLSVDDLSYVFVVEGEKDVDGLAAIGLVATCNSGGAGKWLASFAKYLKGRRVVILPDNDEPGQKHASKVAESVRPVAKSVQILDLPNLPPKGDVSDWLAAGGTAEKLVEIVETALCDASHGTYVTGEEAIKDLFACTSLPTLKTPFPLLNDALGGGLMAGQVYVQGGGTGSGKTAFATQIAVRVAQDAPVIIVSFELPPRLIAARAVSQKLQSHGWLDCIRGRVSPDKMLACLPERLVFANRPTLHALEGAIKDLADRYGQAPLVIIDYLQLVGGVVATTDRISDLRAANSAASDRIREIADTHKTAMIVVSSVSRGSNVRIRNARDVAPGELVDVAKESGSIEYDAGAVVVLSTSQEEDDQDRQVATVTVAKNRFGRLLHLDYRFEGASGLWTEIGEVERRANTDLRDQILESLRRADVPLTKTAVIKRGGEKMVRGRKADIFGVIAKLLEAGELRELDGKLMLPNMTQGAA